MIRPVVGRMPRWPFMTELTKGFSTSSLLHGLVLVAFLGTSWHTASGGRGSAPSGLKYGSPNADPRLISTPPPESAADPITDVSELESIPEDADNPFAPDPVKAPDLPVGMEILKPRDLRKNPPKTAAKKPLPDKSPKTVAESTRLQKIREGLRKTLQPRTATARTGGTAAKINSETIRSRLGNQIKNEVVSVQVGGGLPGGNSLIAGGSPNGTGLFGGSGGSGRGDPFMDAISAVLHDAWQQPTRAAVGEANPVVRVKLTVQADGSISDYGVVKASGNAAMDVSVITLFRSLKKRPPLADLGKSVPELTLTVDFKLDPN